MRAQDDAHPPPRGGRRAQIPLRDRRRRTPGRRRTRRLLVLLAVTLVAVAFVRAVLVQSFVVPTGSMDPTVRVGDRVLVTPLSYRLGEIERGDVVVFDGAGIFEPAVPPARSPLAQLGRGISEVFSMPAGSRAYVKRVIGLPGERVSCCDPGGRLMINGKPLVEPYIEPPGAASGVPFDVLVPPGRMWVMGDHRSASADSRAHVGDPGGGTVPMDRVVGRVVGIYWPVAHAGGVSGGPPQLPMDVQQAEGSH